MLEGIIYKLKGKRPLWKSKKGGNRIVLRRNMFTLNQDQRQALIQESILSVRQTECVIQIHFELERRYQREFMEISLDFPDESWRSQPILWVIRVIRKVMKSAFISLCCCTTILWTGQLIKNINLFSCRFQNWEVQSQNIRS
jgi:hypothetical protein